MDEHPWDIEMGEDGHRKGPREGMDPETREAFEESYARYERMLKKLAKL